MTAVVRLLVTVPLSLKAEVNFLPGRDAGDISKFYLQITLGRVSPHSPRPDPVAIMGRSVDA